MKLQEIFKEIESHEFSSRLRVASDFQTLIRGADQESSVLHLYKALESRSERQKVLNRVLEIARQEVDLRYENPMDTSLTVYLWCIYFRDLQLAGSIAQTIIKIPQCWWAHKLSCHIMLGGYLESSAGYEVKNFEIQSYGIGNQDTGDLIQVSPLMGFLAMTSGEINFISDLVLSKGETSFNVYLSNESKQVVFVENKEANRVVALGS